MIDNEVPRFAPNGNRLPERLPVGHRLVDTIKQQWLIGPPIGSGGFGEIYLTRQYNENSDSRLTQAQIIAQSVSWNHVIKFEHFSGPLFAEINFYLRVAKKETIEEYMAAKKLKHLGMPRFIASGIYDPAKPNNPLPVCKNVTTTTTTNGTTISCTKKGNIKKAARTKTAAPPPANRQTNKNNNREKKYRFLVMQRFGPDVEKILIAMGSRFDMKTAFTLALKIIDTLEYIHSHGYVHADVKASNLLMGLKDSDMKQDKNSTLTNDISSNQTVNSKRQTKSANTTNPRRKVAPRSMLATTGPITQDVNAYKDYTIGPTDEVYLIDFGLVEKYCHIDGKHREYTEDQRRANNGTVEFSSRDAHIGAFSRRSDLESLAYNLLYWVSGGRLPWISSLKDHHLVETSKKWYMNHLEEFVNYCFNEDAEPIDAAKILAEDRASLKMNGNGLSGKIPNNNGNSHISNHLSNHTENESPKYNNSTATSRASSASTTVTNSRSASKASRSIASGSTNSTISVSAAKRSRKSASRVTGGTSSRQSSTQDSIMCSALYDFVSYIAKLAFYDDPDYYLLKTILSNALVGTGVNGFPSGRTARKRGGSDSAKKSPPKMILPKCENPTPAMLEILRKMQLKKH